jgi:hypothetical protein
MRHAPFLRRWALTYADPDGTVHITAGFLLRSRAEMHRAALNGRRTTYNDHPPLRVRVLDWGPATQRQVEVVGALSDGDRCAADISRVTAMSPWSVEDTLLTLGRYGWAVCVSDDGPDADRRWRLRTSAEWLANRTHKSPRRR